MSIIDSIVALEACYPGPPAPASVVEDVSGLTPHYRTLIEASPFAVLATLGSGVDVSPFGHGPGFVRIVDEKTLVIPHRRGNGRLDSLRNIISNPRVAILFLIPNSNTTLRVDGRAVISADPDLRAKFEIRDSPATVLIVTVETAYFESHRSVLKAGLWNPVTWGNPEHLPSQADMLEEIDAAGARDRMLECA